MAFKGPITFDGGGNDDLKSRFADAITSGLTVHGADDVRNNLRNWSGLSVFVTAFTCKRTAEAVFKKSQRHVPVDTAELYESGYISEVGGADAAAFSRATVIEENIEGTVAAYAKSLAVKASFTGPSGFFGKRVFTKYSVGYLAPHASIVHENPFGQVWRNDSPNREFNDPKMDHFLLNAYHMYAHRHSNAVKAGLKEIEIAIAATAAKQARALSSGSGMPRLVKK